MPIKLAMLFWCFFFCHTIRQYISTSINVTLNLKTKSSFLFGIMLN
uniref:Uncharacterized protein n=1 Tax=Anguilla anguilla TaxID=7936 RepID=A0A0E9Y1P4_ANGAN